LLFVRLPLHADDPGSLQIRIIEGEGQSYPVGSRATRGITVEVDDENGKPVDRASVHFALPENGPTGVFSNGSKTDLLLTGADGRAGVWGMRWNRQPGFFDIRITVGKGQTRAGTVVSQHLVEASGTSVSAGGSSHKWLWIGLAAAAGVGAGVAVAARGGSSPGSCSTTVVLAQNPCSATPTNLGVTVIGQPTINLGHP